MTPAQRGRKIQYPRAKSEIFTPPIMGSVCGAVVKAAGEKVKGHGFESRDKSTFFAF